MEQLIPMELRRELDERCVLHDLDLLRVPHNAVPPYPGGAKDADEFLMAMRDVDWVYDQHESKFSDGLTLWYTRWL